jgi:hypothetical protein
MTHASQGFLHQTTEAYFLYNVCDALRACAVAAVLSQAQALKQQLSVARQRSIIHR